MPNPIKYSTSAQTLALKKGNFYIGTGDVGKGPTSTTDYYNGITPPSGGYTIYLNKASGGPSIYTAANDSQLISLTNTISVSTNLIKNNNGGNFADGTIAPFNGAYGTLPTIVDISNDRPYTGSASTKAAKFVAGGGMVISTSPSPFTMTIGVTYTFSFWYRQTNANQFYIAFNNQGGSGDVNGNFQAYSSYGYFSNPTQTWQRCSWTFTNVIDKLYFFIYSMSSVDGSECLMTEFTLTEGSMPGGPGLTTAGNCLNWFGSVPTDKMIFNRDYEPIVTNGLVLNLDAGFSPSFATIPSNTNGNTLPPWYDLSGNGNNGTLTNGPTFSSANGGSIVFDGVDDYVSGSCNLTGQNITVNLWCYPTTTGVYKTALTNMIYDGTTTGYAIQQRNSGTFWVVIGSWGISGDLVDGIPYTVNQWINLVLTYNGATISAYKNGSLFGTTPSTRTFSAGSLVIGAGERAQSEYFQGNIPIAQIYSRALSAAEVLQNFNAQKGRFGL
jgi:hypothetical protein